jgi:hypothetical protein
MDFNIYIVIGIAVFTMFFGYFFGLFEGRGQGYKKRKKEEAEGVESETPETEPGTPEAETMSLEAEPGTPEEPLAEPQPTMAPVEIPEVTLPPSLMRLSQDPEGRLQLEMDNEPVNTATISPDQRKRLIALLTALRPWLEGKTTEPAMPGPAPAPPLTPRPAPAPAPVVPDAALPGALVAAEEVPTAPQSIVAQIDAILQIRITGTELQQAGIKLQESPEGGVLVWVGLDKYQSVDEVPDEAIKAAIRAAIVEWENKFTPGIKG